jgi:hypothetical protein
MRDQHPAPWSPVPPGQRAGGGYRDHPTRLGEPPGESRSDGLRRLSRLTWRATQLGALATVGFATLFARTAPAATTPGHPAPKVTATASTAAPSPAASRAPHRHRHHHAHKPAAGPAPATGPAAPVPSPTLAAPTTPPAPPPPSPAPSPVHTTSSPSHGGG